MKLLQQTQKTAISKTNIRTSLLSQL